MRIQAARECDRLGQWRARGVSFRKKSGSARELIGSTAAGYVIDQSHGELDDPNTSCALPIELEP